MALDALTEVQESRTHKGSGSEVEEHKPQMFLDVNNRHALV